MANGPGYPNELKSFDTADGYSVPTMVMMESRLVDQTYPTFQMLANGSQLLGNGTAAPAANFDITTADVVLADATLVASTLSIVAAASTRYLIEFMLKIVTPEADDFKFQVNGPSAGATGEGYVSAPALLSTVAAGDVLGGFYTGWVEGTATAVGSEDTGPVFVHGTGWVLLDATAGAVTITVAKNADAGADGNLKSGSWMRLIPVAA